MAANLHTTVSVTPSFIIPTAQNDSKHIASLRFQIGLFQNCKTMDELRQLHCYASKQGLIRKQSTVTKLISTCVEMGTLESLDYARKVFELFQEDDEANVTVFIYNSLIRGYSASGLCDEAVSLYIQMIETGFVPDNFTFPFLLSACAKTAAFSGGVQLHGALTKIGLEGNMFVANSLIHLYAEARDFSSARKVFDEMPERNVVSWTSLICGYARTDSSSEAVALFFQMIEAGVRPNSVTMVCVISACSKLKDLELAMKIHAYIEESEVELNTHMVNALVDMYMKCGETAAARLLYNECVDKNLVLCNTIMSNFARQGMPKEVLSVMVDMFQVDLQPDRVSLLSAISACGQMGDYLLGRCCHNFALRNGYEGWDNICNAMIDMYMKCGKQEMAYRVFHGMSNKTIVSWNSLLVSYVRNRDLESTKKIFNEMLEKDIVSWNTMVSALVQESMFEEAIELFREMQTKEIEADRVTMVEVASACGYLGALELAKWIYAYIIKNNIDCDMLLETALVDMFARCGDSRSAMKVFDNMDRKDVSAWTAAIGAMAVDGNGERAIELYSEMLRQGVKPDQVVFVNILTACSHGGFVEQGQLIFESMKQHGISPQIVHYGCMVDLLGRAGKLEEALDIIKSMSMKPNGIIWGSLLAACRTHKNVELATFAAERLAETAPERSGIHVLLSNIYASAEQWADVANVRLHLKEKGVRKMPGSSSIEVDGVIHEFTSGDRSHPETCHIDMMLKEITNRLGDAGYVPDLTNVLLDVNEQEKHYLLNQHSEKLAMAYGLISTKKHLPIRVIKNLRTCSDCHAFAKYVSKVYDREITIRDNNRFHFFRQGLCSCGDYW
ncbi:pentatricopeptide repeat-containing protein At3g22690-like [Cucurbita maxima]|uniref:Pentatricopeptide repeat-containing protein At3g22690-like n=1 Tax=Cucurbita maxima TaxID=3661 RepID=A0A6J1IBE6_CUCMA|nr:pentatricopeptide repeat-containing protein At3g22690-like [Cucurbita maxima]XP_022975129.1 pentatricopeptide repeat-containing protein At3g22690-like [Cucurbita maxima]